MREEVLCIVCVNGKNEGLGKGLYLGVIYSMKRHCLLKKEEEEEGNRVVVKHRTYTYDLRCEVHVS